MSNDEATTQNVPDDPSSPRPGSRGRRAGRRLVAVATGTTLALGAGGIAYAATTDPTRAPSASTAPDESAPAPSDPEHLPGDRDGDPPRGGFGHHGGDFVLGPRGLPLHGEQVVETDDGVYETIATQRGTVDAVRDDELTVTSADGYTRTYAVTADSLTGGWPDEAATVDLAVGDEVLLVATVDSDSATVTRVVDLGELPAAGAMPFPDGGRQGWGPGAPDERPDAGTSELPDTAA